MTPESFRLQKKALALAANPPKPPNPLGLVPKPKTILKTVKKALDPRNPWQHLPNPFGGGIDYHKTKWFNPATGKTETVTARGNRNKQRPIAGFNTPFVGKGYRQLGSGKVIPATYRPGARTAWAPAWLDRVAPKRPGTPLVARGPVGSQRSMDTRLRNAGAVFGVQGRK